jgi:hypothetical protein
MSKSVHPFHLYRYQILPISREIQQDFIEGISDINDLLEKKNEIFWNSLSHVHKFESRTELSQKRIYFEDSFALFKIAANRSLNRETKDFKEEELDNWPSIYAAVWNQPDKQIIAVEKRIAAFQHSETVVRMIIDAVNFRLSKHLLRAHWEPQFEKTVFWDLVKQHKDKIHEICFELVTPNMANISNVLDEGLKNFAKSTNTATTSLKIESDTASSLSIKQDDPAINSLVDYASEGGGDISIRLHGFKKKIHTSKTVKEIDISEVSLTGDAKYIVDSIKQILSQ